MSGAIHLLPLRAFMARAGQLYLSPVECLENGPKKSILVVFRKRNSSKWNFA